MTHDIITIIQTNNTVSTTSVQNFEEKEVNGKENDINEDKFVLVSY